MFLVSVNAKCFESSYEDENGCPPVIKTERKMDEDFITEIPSSVVFLHNIVDVTDSGAHAKSKDEGEYVIVVGPQMDVGSVDKGQEWESPTDCVNCNMFSRVSELIDNVSKEQKMDK